ncbi:MAG: methyltransferase family protein [Rubrobacter sp.]
MSKEPEDGKPGDTVGVVAPPPAIFGVPLLVSLAANRRLALRLLPERFRGLRHLAGWTLIAGGFGLLLWSGATMRAAKTPVSPYSPSEKLVDGGPFAHSRNPIYTAMTLFYCGAALLGNSLPSIIPLPAVIALMNRSVIEREETYLKRKFEAEYERYTERVGRWL